MFFQCGKRLLITRKLTGQFPDYERVLPRENDRVVTVPRAEMEAAILRVSQFADERSHAIRVALAAGELRLASSGSDVGESEESLPVENVPGELQIGFNAQYLLDFLRCARDVPIMLLHCYPYEREAGYLAQAFNNVYLDGGLAINYLGARSTPFIGRLLEMAPFRKILYSSDGFGPAELHFLGAHLWRNGIREVLQRFVDADEWSEADAIRVVDLIARGNAQRVYGLG